MNEYLTIKEVAEIAGVTQQAVYKQLNNKLKKYYKEVEGKKRLHIDVLKEFNSTVEQNVEQPLNKSLTTSLTTTIELLSKQLDQKDKQINDLNDRLKEAQELNRNQQILLKQEQSKSPLLTIGEADRETPAKKKWWNFKR